MKTIINTNHPDTGHENAEGNLMASKAYIRDFTGRAKPEHKDAALTALVEKLNSGEKPTPEERRRIGKGEQRRMGWLFNFQPVMRKFVVKTDHYLEETYAFNKTDAREQFKGLGRVRYIADAPNPWG